MTASQRRLIRERLDEEARKKLETPPRPAVCRACNCNIDAFTRGCVTCARRHARRARQDRS